MGTKTEIAWTDHTWNAWWGCFKVSEECKHCYAETFAKRVGKKIWGPSATTDRWLLSENNWKKPLQWNQEAERERCFHRVFCASMSDVFEDHPAVSEARQRLWGLIEQTPWLNWQLLTKRPENILKMVPWGAKWPENAWVGTSVGTQARAIERIPQLLKVPASIRFLSCEPLLEAVDLSPWLSELQWVIVGGESGPKHRPFNPDWARSLREQCLEADVRFFFKQHGGTHHSSGGNLLDGRTWQEFPLPRLCMDDWGQLATALTLSHEKVMQDNGPINEYYCWEHDGPNMGGWSCAHPVCRKTEEEDQQ
jgi:protein gp37